MAQPEWPVYRAEGYKELFMYDQNKRLRWFPNWETFLDYGYTEADVEVVDISWFYYKPILESIMDSLTGECYPAEETPNYKYYTGEIVPKPPVTGIMEWLKANWPWLAIGGLGVGLTIALLKRRK